MVFTRISLVIGCITAFVNIVKKTTQITINPFINLILINLNISIQIIVFFQPLNGSNNHILSDEAVHEMTFVDHLLFQLHWMILDFTRHTGQQVNYLFQCCQNICATTSSFVLATIPQHTKYHHKRDA